MTKSRCISGCKGLETEFCEKAPRCSYANGEKRKFCRLRRTFKMNKYDCSVRKKTNKNQKVLTIQKFIQETAPKRRSEFLKAICSDSGFCYAIGNNRKKIFDFFNGFVNFEFVKPPIVSIGNPSANGFVKSVKYERLGYSANAVLKSSSKQTADNLAYEFLVGMFLNQMGDRFPCFVQTYGLYYYLSDYKWEHARNTNHITTNIMKDSLQLHTKWSKYKNNINYVLDEDVCSNSKYAAILIQHFSNIKTFDDVLTSSINQPDKWCKFTLNELPSILYQTYMPLAVMSKEFTHYDLHHNNILLYEPAPGKYIQYHYHHGNETVTFKSKYIVKIIDYGRAFYKNSEINRVSSTDVLKSVCVLDDCNIQGEECGNKSGFKFLSNTLTPSEYFMSSSEHNPSADLRFIYILKR